MKLQKLIGIIPLFTCFFLVLSCSNDDDDRIKPSLTLIELEGEGGETEVTFDNGDWEITGVKNKNGGVYIHGDIFSSEGKLIRENSRLMLSETGRLEALWGNKGFLIVRDTPYSLKITVTENSTGDDFGFALELRSGEETKEVSVMQKRSQGYRFDKIEYFIQGNDGDSLFVKKKNKESFTTNTTFEIGIYPFNGEKRISCFICPDEDAFVWLRDTAITVEVPFAFYEDKVYCNNNGDLYTDVTAESDSGFKHVVELVSVPPGKTEFTYEIEYRKRTVSYVLTLTNKRTEEKKIVEGKWIETIPTGKYTVESVSHGLE